VAGEVEAFSFSDSSAASRPKPFAMLRGSFPARRGRKLRARSAVAALRSGRQVFFDGKSRWKFGLFAAALLLFPVARNEPQVLRLAVEWLVAPQLQGATNSDASLWMTLPF
jgi:hypothetical protein